jgi:sortase A
VRHRLLAAAAAGLAAWLLAGAGWIHGKAVLAQWLIAAAWHEGASVSGPVKPWPWADTWPVARLRVPALEVDQYVLHGVHGQALAFGPGLDPAGAEPGAAGTVLIAGHRDTHFRWLATLPAEATLLLDSRGGGQLRYRVTARWVADSRAGPLLPPPGAALLLVTCFPFDAVRPGGPLRYVVAAVPA